MDVIHYEGSVDINLMRGKKVVKKLTSHNNGTSELFRLLCNCIIGNNMAMSMPKYVQLYSSSTPTPGSEITTVRTHSSLQSVVTEVTTGSEEVHKAQLEFIIPSAYLRSGDINCLAIYGQAQTSAPLLASVSLQQSIHTPEDGSNLQIVWTMTFSN